MVTTSDRVDINQRHFEARSETDSRQVLQRWQKTELNGEGMWLDTTVQVDHGNTQRKKTQHI